MTGILPEGENVRRALRWIAEERRARPDAPLAKLLDEAMRRFDLTPIQCERLVELYRAARERDPDA
ncbi:MAG: hypothetical protein DCC71_23140 [Proteobacteria bacterium]|nr:MAG: hypothetical protein DCC71_23140 [Pseudomonadota bacterium]